MEKATHMMSSEMIGQAIEIATGPPLLNACPKLVKHPASTEMIENEIAKFEKLDQPRLSSCAYPSSARRDSSLLTVSEVLLIPVLLAWG